ncbi:MAG: hypothetical protein Q9172_001638 [Xanthocarpia lactea]
MKPTPNGKLLPVPLVVREPGGSLVRINTKNLSYTMTLQLYTYGFRPRLTDGAYEHQWEWDDASKSFSIKARQLRGLGSLLQRQKDLIKSFPGIENHAGIFEIISRVDSKLEGLSYELGQLQSVTKGVLEKKDYGGDSFAFWELQRRAGQESGP